MRRHVVYEVVKNNNSTTPTSSSSSSPSPSSPTLFAVAPVDPEADYFRLDTRMHRGSTNVVEFRGALLGMGHRRIVRPPPTTYYHLLVRVLSGSSLLSRRRQDLFLLPENTRRVRISYALGLAHEAQQHHLYLPWSEAGSVPRLRRYVHAPADPRLVLELVLCPLRGGGDTARRTATTSRTLQRCARVRNLNDRRFYPARYCCMEGRKEWMDE